MGKFSCLAKCGLTKSWPLEERAAIAHFLEPKSLPQGSAIIDAGNKERILYLIEQGTARVQYENIAFILEEGESFGELSLISSTQRLVEITADKNLTMWTLRHEKFEEMKKMAPAVALRLTESITQKFTELLNTSVVSPKMLASVKSS